MKILQINYEARIENLAKKIYIHNEHGLNHGMKECLKKATEAIDTIDAHIFKKVDKS